MTEVSERYRRIADGFTSRLDGIGDSQWEARTPCDEWDVRALVAHVVRTNRAVLANLDGTEAESVDTEGDLGAQWASARSGITAALDDEARSRQMVGGTFGEQTFESLVGRLLCADTLLHTWDLARATGQDDRLDPDAVRKSQEFLAPIDDAIRRPGGFAPKIAPAPDADEQTRLLNFCGRPA